MSILTPVLAVIAIPAMFLVLVAPHEGGHFLFAKLFRIRVHEYSLFMGTRVWSRVRGETVYAVRAIPIGGFVRLAGMEPGDQGAPDGFHSKPAWQRVVVLVAGPFVNFVLAAVIMCGIFLSQVNSDPGKVLQVDRSTAAAAAGLKAGDSVKSVDGVQVRSPQDIR
ncbi:MAG: site-2 protease family protein, partial [Candidatus Dormibacterales bacterium]